MKTQRQLMLNRFYLFFVESGQSQDDLNRNFDDIQKILPHQLTAMFNAFFS